MNPQELVVGAPYVVAGRGEMLLAELDDTYHDPGGRPVCRMLGHGRGDYWCKVDQLVRRATAEDIQRRAEQARVRNVDCNNPGCWCVKYRVKEKP